MSYLTATIRLLASRAGAATVAAALAAGSVAAVQQVEPVSIDPAAASVEDADGTDDEG